MTIWPDNLTNPAVNLLLTIQSPENDDRRPDRWFSALLMVGGVCVTSVSHTLNV